MSAEHLQLETIGGFVDGELTPEDSAAVQAHLRDCHACTLRLVEAQKLKTATRRAADRFTPTNETLARLEARVRNGDAKKNNVVQWPKIAWAGIAASVLAVATLGGATMFRSSDALSAELLDQHLSVLSDAATPQVLSSDRHTVKPWFQGKLPFSFNVPEANTLPPDTILVGADLTYVEGKPTAMLLFTIHKHRVSILITQAGLFEDALLPRSRSGFEMVHARAAGLEFTGVSDVNRAELESLLDVLTKAQ